MQAVNLDPPEAGLHSPLGRKVGPFLVAAMGFAAFLMATGLLTLRTGVFTRWIGIVALLGAVSFLITFLTVLDGTTDGSAFGYGFFPGIASLVIWTATTSVAMYRSARPSGVVRR